MPSLEGVQRVRVTNQEETSLTELYFRLYPNLPAYEGAAGPVRSFYAAVTDRWEAISEEVDGITVNSYYPVGGLASAQRALSHTTGSLGVFNRMFGHYPYRELDVVPLPTTAFGMEHKDPCSCTPCVNVSGTRRSLRLCWTMCRVIATGSPMPTIFWTFFGVTAARQSMILSLSGFAETEETVDERVPPCLFAAARSSQRR